MRDYVLAVALLLAPPATRAAESLPAPPLLATSRGDTLRFESSVAIDGGVVAIQLGPHAGSTLRSRPLPKCVYFSIRSECRVGILRSLASRPRAASDETILERYRALLGANVAKSFANRDTIELAGEYPHDWYRRACEEFTPALPLPMRLTFVAYDDPHAHEPDPPPSTDGIPHLRKIRPPWTRSDKWPAPETVARGGRVIGSVIVDPSGWTVRVEER